METVASETCLRCSHTRAFHAVTPYLEDSPTGHCQKVDACACIAFFGESHFKNCRPDAFEWCRMNECQC